MPTGGVKRITPAVVLSIFLVSPVRKKNMVHIRQFAAQARTLTRLYGNMEPFFSAGVGERKKIRKG